MTKSLDAIDRRTWLEVVGTTMTAALAGGCERDPIEHALPYVHTPEELARSDTREFATTMTVGSRAIGLVATSYRGRPIKLDGNPLHPASRGGSDAAAQAAIYGLYDTDRSQTIRHLGEISSWSAFLEDMRPKIDAQRASQGAGLRVLTERALSPTLRRQLTRLREQFPSSRIYELEPATPDASDRAIRNIFGRPGRLVYHFDRADVVVSLDSNFLADSDAGPRAISDLMKRRDTTRSVTMNRVYVAEATPSVTGASSDYRLAVAASQIPTLLREMCHRLAFPRVATSSDAGRPDAVRRWLDLVLHDLEAHRGSSIVVPGERQPWQIHAAAFFLNQALGNLPEMMELLEPDKSTASDHFAPLDRLRDELSSGRVELLFLLGCNPVYTAPVDYDFASRLQQVRDRTVQIASYQDETSRLCHWHIPQTHFLETWSDARTFDGTASIGQPLIAPLFEAKSVYELLGVLLDEPQKSSYDWVRETWLGAAITSSPSDTSPEKRPSAATMTEPMWERSVRDGVIAESGWPTLFMEELATSTTLDELLRDSTFDAASHHTSGTTCELNFFVDPTIHDGRFANNGWLQELPKPWSQLTWDNAVYLSPSMARRLGANIGDWLQIDGPHGRLIGPAYPLEGMAETSVSVSLGYGRTAGGRFAEGRGINAYAVRRSTHPWIVPEAQVTRLAGRASLATTQEHHRMEGRSPAREQNFPPHAFPPSAHTNNHAAPHAAAPSTSASVLPTLYPEREPSERAWGMVIDLTKCVGCKACVVACQAENNIPIVGKEGVLRSREMHWLRIDTYFIETTTSPMAIHQPMLCQHCEHAPCEVVCPVAATSHSSEGLNEMTYNRCVGTRYCSNNCPYKVRRFNYLNYVEDESELARLRANPDVTVRTRGVMEKCTYCVQRINSARRQMSIEAAQSGEPLVIRDGTVVTACQAACPARAIEFGDLHDSQSEVSRLRQQPHHYGVLEELGTRPRTTYLARVTHLSPESHTAANDAAEGQEAFTNE